MDVFFASLTWADNQWHSAYPDKHKNNTNSTRSLEAHYCSKVQGSFAKFWIRSCNYKYCLTSLVFFGILAEMLGTPLPLTVRLYVFHSFLPKCLRNNRKIN